MAVDIVEVKLARAAIGLRTIHMLKISRRLDEAFVASHLNGIPPGIYAASEFDAVFVGGHTMTIHKEVMAELGLRPSQEVSVERMIEVTRFNLAQSEAIEAIKKAQLAARGR
jgi:hypothetical protein